MEEQELSLTESVDLLCFEQCGCHPSSGKAGGPVTALQTDNVRNVCIAACLCRGFVINASECCGTCARMDSTISLFFSFFSSNDTEQTCKEQRQKKMLRAIFKE